MKNIDRPDIQEFLNGFYITSSQAKEIGYDADEYNYKFSNWLNAEYEKPKKYYWKLKGSFDGPYIYLNIKSNETLTLYLSSVNKTKSTEDEYKKLAEQE